MDVFLPCPHVPTEKHQPAERPASLAPVRMAQSGLISVNFLSGQASKKWGQWGQIGKKRLSACHLLENLSPNRMGTGPEIPGTAGTNRSEKPLEMIFFGSYSHSGAKKATESGQERDALGQLEL